VAPFPFEIDVRFLSAPYGCSFLPSPDGVVGGGATTRGTAEPFTDPLTVNLAPLFARPGRRFSLFVLTLQKKAARYFVSRRRRRLFFFFFSVQLSADLPPPFPPRS